MLVFLYKRPFFMYKNIFYPPSLFLETFTFSTGLVVFTHDGNGYWFFFSSKKSELFLQGFSEQASSKNMISTNREKIIKLFHIKMFLGIKDNK